MSLCDRSNLANRQLTQSAGPEEAASHQAGSFLDPAAVLIRPDPEGSLCFGVPDNTFG
jgi:hypothetical protein